MKITAPFDRAAEVKSLIEAGADELYCGICSSYWKFKGLSPNERLGFCSLGSFRQLKEALGISKIYQVPVFLCFNTYFNKGAFASACKDISSAIKLGINGFVISDLGFIPFIKKLDRNCKIILSCMNTCFNSKTLEFFKDWGIDRVVLDRQLTLRETEVLAQDARKIPVELEVFIQNITCRNINANCLWHKIKPNSFLRQSSFWRFARHTSFLKKAIKLINKNRLRGFCIPDMQLSLCPCRVEFEASILKIQDRKAIKEKTIKPFSFDGDLSSRYCAVCSLYFLQKFDIAAVKIIGRGFITQKKIQDVNFVRRYLTELASGAISEVNFLLKGRKLYREIYGHECLDRQCHHIEVYQYKQSLMNQAC